MGGQLLFELLQDRTFLLFLSDFSELSGEQVGQTGIDLIYHQIGTVAEAPLSSSMGMVFAHALLS